MKFLFTLACLTFLFFSSNAQLNPNACLADQSFDVVVLGSSTAAGTGPTSPDSAWVWRYRAYLKSINANNTVTNLAKGGYSTFHLMPTGFPKPTGRPGVDTTRNITAGLNLNPDVIIVNLPSNDRQFPLGESIFNFYSIAQEALIAGVPIYFTTTQPITTFPSSGLKQIKTKNSIDSLFGKFAIDFWSPFVEPVDTSLKGIYDSGDGIHMNDDGHGLLFERIVSKDVITPLVDTSIYTTPDILISDLLFDGGSDCGDTVSKFTYTLSNAGLAYGSVFNISVSTRLLPSGTPVIQNINIPKVEACQVKTSLVPVNTSSGGMFEVIATSNLPTDPNSGNNKDTAYYNFLTQPIISSTIGDTICGSSVADLTAIPSSGDTVVWYDNVTGGNIVGYGRNFTTPILTSGASYYAEAVAGQLHNVEELQTTLNTNTNWNGVMFDLTPSLNATIDSLQFVMNSTGPQGITVLQRFGSYKGHEQDSMFWFPMFDDTLLVSNPGELVTINFNPFTIFANDTFGIYIYCHNPASNLSYKNSGGTNQSLVTDGKLDIVTGSGIAHKFGLDYFPRIWAGKVYYHHGSNPQGECNSNREKVNVDFYQVGIDAVGDSGCQMVTLTNTNYNAANYSWSNGSTTNNATFTTSGKVWLDLDHFCGSFTDTFEVVLFQNAPVADFNLQILPGTKTIQPLNTTTDAVSYKWLFGDGNSSTMKNPLYTYQNFGSYTLKLVAFNECGSDTLEQTFNLTTSIGDIDFTSLKAYPNPFNDGLFIQYPETINSLSIIDALGRHFDLILHDNGYADLKEFSSGIYYLVIETETGIGSIRLQKN